LEERVGASGMRCIRVVCAMLIVCIRRVHCPLHSRIAARALHQPRYRPAEGCAALWTSWSASMRLRCCSSDVRCDRGGRVALRTCAHRITRTCMIRLSHLCMSAGTGKTLLARAVANSTDACFIRVIGSELVQKYVGEGARMVRELFQLARSKKACIVFFDEIDASQYRGEREAGRENGGAFGCECGSMWQHLMRPRCLPLFYMISLSCSRRCSSR
jgi:hypothetical protein